MERAEDLPEITITPRDLSRLDLLTGFVVAYRTPVRATLARELRRARIVAAHALPSDVVTMHSRVRYRDEAGVSRTVTVVYPGEEERAEGKVSVLASLGGALIGLSAGQRMRYQDADGRERAVQVLEVLFQPEAAEREAALAPSEPPSGNEARS
jgi:regulator of nucleoside diphosphate kinase